MLAYSSRRIIALSNGKGKFEDSVMELYRELYYRLFGVMSDAVESLENREPIAAKRMLISALREAEERVLASEEELNPR